MPEGQPPIITKDGDVVDIKTLIYEALADKATGKDITDTRVADFIKGEGEFEGAKIVGSDD